MLLRALNESVADQHDASAAQSTCDLADFSCWASSPRKSCSTGASSVFTIKLHKTIAQHGDQSHLHLAFAAGACFMFTK
jgi:hypothetical protein